MNKSILIGMTALALVTGACGKKAPPRRHRPRRRPTPMPPAPATDVDDDVELVELPGDAGRPRRQGGLGHGLFRHRQV